ncbi:MAG: N-acetylmuramoyl-L-alanine amidase [Roseburia sp.]
MNAEKRRKRRLRNIVSATYCTIQLLLVLCGIKLFEGFLTKLQQVAVEVQTEAEMISTEEKQLVEEKNNDELVVCLDAGHGGKDEGSSFWSRLEKDDNLNLAKAICAYLEEQEVTVVMTRTEDVFLSLEERCEVANNAGADYFVSLHRNKGDGYGVETWVYSAANEETMTLAEGIMQGLVEVGVQKDRGVKKGTQKSGNSNYYVNNHTNMPACIVELGFMNSSTDNSLYDEHLTDYAKAIGDAILTSYEQYHNEETAQEDMPQEETEQDDIVPDDGQDQGSMVVNAPIDNVESLSGECLNWGMGKSRDEKNRPSDAVNAQEKYGNYQAYFIKEDSQKIYLTFDEGYEYGQTASILDTLKEKNVKAVFFITEPYAKAQPELVQRMIDEGHTIGNHSVNHPADGLPSESLEEQKNEIMENDAYVRENFNYQMSLFRFPAGKYSEQSLAIVNNCNYKSVFWSFAYLDYDVNNQPDRAESLQKMVDKLHPGAIYLLHAESETNAAVLGDFIEKAQSAGYEIALLE